MTTFYSHRKVADHTYIEVAGIEFEDFAEGQIFEHRPGRTFTAEESRLHAIRSLDLSMRNVDAVYNEKIYGGEELIGESFLISVITALTTKTFGKVVANLGWTNMQFPVPVHAGDTIYAESEILGKRESSSRPNQGIMHAKTRTLNQRGEEVCSFERRFLLYKRGQGRMRRPGIKGGNHAKGLYPALHRFGRIAGIGIEAQLGGRGVASSSLSLRERARVRVS